MNKQGFMRQRSLLGRRAFIQGMGIGAGVLSGLVRAGETVIYENRLRSRGR